MGKWRSVLAVASTAVIAGTMAVTTGSASANPISGAIFTTLANGSEVNFNIYPSKDAVYLNGGPGLHAPSGAAGLPDDTYVFQVTDPSGHTLLSTDANSCRQVTVVGGVFSSVAPSGSCAHNTSTGLDGSLTVQLLPYNDTPNNGGEYKVWVTPVANLETNCAALGVADGLSVVDCGTAPGNDHGFIGADSKTDNFKVKSKSTVEIDTTFTNASSGAPIDGVAETWVDTNGASNRKWSYNDPTHRVNHQAHIEGPENGTHQILVNDQAGCTIVGVKVNGSYHSASGSQDISVTLKSGSKSQYVQVFCS